MKRHNAVFAGLFALSLTASAMAESSVFFNTLMTFGQLPGKHPESSQFKEMSISNLSREAFNELLANDAFSSMAYLDIAATGQDESAIEKATDIFRSGRPVLLKMGKQAPEAMEKVGSIFGISGAFDYALFHRANGSQINVYRLEGYEDEAILDAVRQLITQLQVQSRSLKDESEFIGLPKLTYNINLQSPSQEMTSVVNIDVIRSAERSQDKKFVSIKTSPTTVRSMKNGITIGGSGPGGTGENLWGAYLPHAYRFTHQLSAQQIVPVLVNSAPASDSRTEFKFSETKTNGLAIGGTLGSEFGATKAENITYAAKSPFNVNFGLNYSHSKSLSYDFKDYSLITSQNGSKLTWNAPIDPKLKGILVDRFTAGMPILSEERMTPMMRSAPLESYTLWELPGNYTGQATVSIGGGYDLNRREWWWDRTQVRSRQVTDLYEAAEQYTLDLNSPFLTREMTVLIRSAEGVGKCMAEGADAHVSLQSCAASNGSQLWGLDSENRYVNRASQRCLSVRETDGALVTQTCALDNRQQWEWQADRLHSLYNRDWRLYSENSRLKVIPDDSMHFQDTPKNVFNPLNIPWASYPRAPSLHDVMPNHLGNSPQISPEWVERYQGVDTRQRWRIEILRDGI